MDRRIRAKLIALNAGTSPAFAGKFEPQFVSEAIRRATEAVDEAAAAFLAEIKGRQGTSGLDAYLRLVSNQFTWNSEDGRWVHRGHSGAAMSYSNGRFTAIAAGQLSEAESKDPVRVKEAIDSAHLDLLESAFAAWTGAAAEAGAKEFMTYPAVLTPEAQRVRKAGIESLAVVRFGLTSVSVEKESYDLFGL